jgi:hypothetical protein
MSEELVTRIGRLRIEAELDSPEPRAPAREQLGVEDAAIRIAANMAGKSDVERRAALREVQPGATITAEGASKTRLTREEKLAKTKAWAETLDEEARAAYLVSDSFFAKSERAQQFIEEAFEAIDGAVNEDNAGTEVDWAIQAIEQDAPYVTVDDEDEDTEDQQFTPLPWEKRDVNGNLYVEDDE